MVGQTHVRPQSYKNISRRFNSTQLNRKCSFVIYINILTMALGVWNHDGFIWPNSYITYVIIILALFQGTKLVAVLCYYKHHTSQHYDVIKWKHFPLYLPFVRGIHRSPVNSPHKGQWRGALMFSLICVWINDWVNNRGAVDLRRYRAHYDVTVMSEPHLVANN